VRLVVVLVFTVRALEVLPADVPREIADIEALTAA